MLRRKFFGAKGAPPQQQSKLSFSTKTDRKKKEEEEEVEESNGEVKSESTEEGDVSAKENSDPQKGRSSGCTGIFDQD